MKKILLSLSMIAVVGVVVAGATGAFFSDTETSAGNFLTAGALDLKINGGDDPIHAVVAFNDLKPSQTWWTRPIKLTIHNNPGKLFKHIVNEPNDPISCNTGQSVTEPECQDQGGLYQNGQCVFPTGALDKNDLHNVTWFDLERWIPGPNAPLPPSMENSNDPKDDPQCGIAVEGTIPIGCWKVGIKDGVIKVGEIASKWIYLGEFGTPLHDNEVIIRQSFHMDSETGNAYQSDSCTFKEEFQVIQTNAPMPLTAFGRDTDGELTPWNNQSVDSFFDVFFDVELD